MHRRSDKGFIEGTVATPARPIPKISTRLGTSDRIGAMCMRLGMGRSTYRIEPGLYAAGNPRSDSDVLVTANYKLTFDKLRESIDGLDVWILALDTKGINVWCAAGKGTFSTEEVVEKIKETKLEKIISHRKLIFPQLSATGVSSHELAKLSGFKAVFGPIRAKDIRAFLANGKKADREMRSVTFTLWERIVLTPVEMVSIGKPYLWFFAASFIVSGIGPGVFSPSAALSRAFVLAIACAAGIASGALITPILLPWLPGRAFSIKGFLIGVISGALLASALRMTAVRPDTIAVLLCTASVSSYLAMKFTGSTPFTSPSGVEREMRKALPVQFASLLISAALWVIQSFETGHTMGG